jgi:hypothetical protein
MRLAMLVAVGCALLPPPRASGQACTEPHYRWTEKTDESLGNLPPVRADVTTILQQWALLDFTGQAQYRCADRIGREQRTYSITGWVRRVKTDEDDGDWHVELTARQDSPTDSCIVLEIPPEEYGGNFALARQTLRALVSWDSHGDLSPPVRLRFIGAAFFDGEHRGGTTRRDQTDSSHGRCNSSARALWELHPVYFVRLP